MIAHVNTALRTCLMDPTGPLQEGWTLITDPEVLQAWYASVPPLPDVPMPEPVPEEVANRQFRLALRRVRGVYPTDVTTAIQAIPDRDTREDALSEWEYANFIRRDNPLIYTLAAIFEVTNTEVDALFRAAISM